ncbi:P-loop containing nucleoside triphosphate hydrolase protein [Exidia glandulosa HHB12029]|uniref:p-loop containing nucleoside triphosphate hydrolase protein n=1 Tax=Exidia glandulosa HHB12029 TaxID=1314781 RepID=A0A165IFN1_EXIGL|nr:P-loop containing nucleoside triphosphate hydrolase protein [Exidia glandulosa HHB12029]
MLDHCSISHKGGVVLWQRSFTPDAASLASSSASPVNSLVREALIDSRAGADFKYEKDGYSIRWSFVNDLELIFVVAYQRILQLTYVDDFITALKTLFVQLYEPFLRGFVASLHAASAGVVPVDAVLWDFAAALQGWDTYFDQVLKKFEDRAAQERRARQRVVQPASPALTPSPPSDDTPDALQIASPDGQEIARNVHAFKARGRGRGRGGLRAGSRQGSDSDTTTASKKKPAKLMRKWGDEAVSESDMSAFDYSADKPSANGGTGNGVANVDIDALVDRASMGARNKEGLYEVKDWILGNDAAPGAALDSAPTSFLGSVFARFTGGKVLTEQDLAPVLEAMKQHLMKKNVAREIADKVCEAVGESLIGKKVSGFKTVKAEVQNALSAALTRILTPKTSTDLLLSIRSKLANAPAASSSANGKRAPYTITFVGVNGVGKSTNLSKVCFWLIQNGFKVLIAACDTFRSGAVEQLRVHVRNLGMLANGEAGGSVELYERGYGKDAAGIAKEAIAYAKESSLDVVLIDTAGRMQDNEPLMRALAKLVSTNNPDKIIFVGEALVGNEAVDQLQKFDRALRDFSSVGGGHGTGRGIDGMLVTKWDTVDDKVGAALSMTYVTGQPIIFVGCGQTYTDLRQLRVGNVVQALLSD